MAIGAGMSCVKYLLFIFNVLFALTGLLILILGASAMMNVTPYTSATQESFYMPGALLFIVLGVVIFLVAFVGFCGAISENHCMILSFSLIMLVIFITELGVGIAAYATRSDLDSELMSKMNESIRHYNDDPSIKKSFNMMQTDLKCCGIVGPSDWLSNDMPIPASCCSGLDITEDKVAACTLDSETLHHAGCYNVLLGTLKKYSWIFFLTGLGIAITQLLGVIFSCFLARSIRNQYETI